MNTYTLFAGCYTEKPGDEGVAAFSFGPSGLQKYWADVFLQSPSYVLPEKDRLYAVEEREQGASVAVFSLARPVPELLRREEVPGRGLCHVCAAHGCLYVSGYAGGSLTGWNPASGQVTARLLHKGHKPNPPRQEVAHVHSALPTPDGTQLLVADLGLDRLFRYEIGPEGDLSLWNSQPWVELPRGEGPRHFVFAEDGKRLFLVTELLCSLFVLRFLPDGRLEMESHIPLFPEGVPAGASGADIQLAPGGRFLYVSVRGTNQIFGFSVSSSGVLSLLGKWASGGKTPRSFSVSPDGLFLAAANQDEGGLSVFSLSAGLLGSCLAQVEQPHISCIKWSPYTDFSEKRL